MRKFLLLALASMFSVSALADDTLIQFQDSNGNSLNGKTLYAKVEDHADPMIPGLVETYGKADVQVVNVSGAVKQCKITYTISEMTSGFHRICFNDCFDTSATGSYEETHQHPMKAGVSEELAAEWFPEGATTGKCSVTYNIEVYKAERIDGEVVYTKECDGPSITVNYGFEDAGIDGVSSEKAVASEEYYNLLGSRVAEPLTGLYVKRITYTDGSVKSVKVSIK